MTNKTIRGGYARISGNKVFRHPEVTVDKGIPIPMQPDIKPEAAYRAMHWVAKKPTDIETPEQSGIKIDEETWLKRRVRDNQKGLKASEGVHGSEWYPVSHVNVPAEMPSVQVSAEVYNINAASYLAGQAQLAPDLGRQLGQGKRTLLRAPGDIIITSSKVHNDQTIQDPSGVVSGIEGMKLK